MTHTFSFLLRPFSRFLLSAVIYLLGGFLLLQFSSTALAGTTLASPRERLLFDQSWRFHLGDSPDAGQTFDFSERSDLTKIRGNELDLNRKVEESRVNPVATNLGRDISWVQADFNDSDWRTLNLPHDWFVELPFLQEGAKDVPGALPNPRGFGQGSKDADPAKGADVGWYRRTFEIPATDAGRQLFLEMDGVFRNSLVWLNGHCLGRHVSGYTGFAYNLTPYANIGKKNVLVVRVDASRSTGWFYEGAGIYRHVWLVKTAPVHVAHWGTYVRSDVTRGGANLLVETTLRNDGRDASSTRLVSTILDPQGKRVAQGTQENVGTAPSADALVKQQIPVPNAQLWSLRKPVLYTLRTQVVQGGNVVDEYTTPFGIRTLRFDANQGFFLNGEHVNIDGTCNHQDHAGVGAALPDRIQTFRIEKLKELGTNAYRTSHNPPAPELLDECDRQGMLVMDETRNVGATPEALNDLRDLILRDRNHPSVFIWSLGNEEPLQGDDKLGTPMASAMQDVAHSLDPSRLCTIAMNGGWGRGFSRVLDVMGYNYWRNGNVEKYHQDFPAIPSIGTEDSSAFQTRGFYGTIKERSSPNWDEIDEPGTYRDTIQHTIAYYAQRPYIAGVFLWTGFDYRGEPTPFGPPQISSNFGLLDTCGFAKDNAYLLKAWWGTKPTLHIYNHWNQTGKEGQPIRVWVVGNSEQVELFLNGKSQGRRPMPRYGHIEWQVPYAPGTLVAKGYSKGKPTIQERIETTGPATEVRLVPDRSTLKGDGEDVSLVTVQVVDAKGRVVPGASHLVHFHVDGGTILGVGNGDPVSHEADQSDKRSVFHGLAQIILQTKNQPGTIRLSAEAEGLHSASIAIAVNASSSRPCVP